MKKGLILEGGAMRGMFTAGVIDVMMENGIEYDGLVGVSAGACFGCNYKSRQVGRTIRYNMKYCRDKRYCSLKSLITTGDLFGAQFCYETIPRQLDPFDYDEFARNPMEFHVVCTDVETGKAVYYKLSHGRDDEMLLIRASASMPLAARIVEVNGKKLLDGGAADSVPLKYFEALGYTKNVVVLTQPEGYVKGPNKAMPIMKRVLKRYPNMISTMENRHKVYNETTAYIRQREQAGACFVIRPEKPLPIGRIEHDPAKLKAVYDEGRRIMEGRLGALKSWLETEIQKNS